MTFFLVLFLIWVGFLNLVEGLGVFADGYREWSFSRIRSAFICSDLKENFLAFLTLPGAIIGFILGIITFQWTHWNNR